MHRAIIFFLLALLCCLPTYAVAASTTTIHAEWAGYMAPTGLTISGFKLYQEGTLACQTQTATATSLDCTVSLTADTTNFTLTAAFTDGTESPHSVPFAFSLPTTTPPQATITADVTSGTVPFTVNLSGANSTGSISSYQWNFGDGSTGTGATVTHTFTTAGSRTVQLNVLDGNNQSSVATTTITANAPVANTPPTAAITTSASSGTAPVTITFNGSGSTAGSSTITSYKWSFGDGSTGSGATASHSYTTAGTFTTTLTVTDSKGLANSASTVITVSAPVVLTPPTAVVATSTAAGPAPLAVTFDGTGSKAASGSTIASYAWSFGDGASASGATASHSFTTAGSHTATLTVTDNKGLTSSANTPIVVSAPVITNKAPSAVISATPTSGTSPLAAIFDGSGSTDPDGTIASYIWNFGDGSTASGKTSSHTYTTKAKFIASLTVKDNQGASHTTSTVINVQDEPLTAEIEVGEVAVTGSWVRVPISNTFQNPIVIAGPPSFNDSAPCAVRIRNVTPTGFEIRVAEWNYLDGVHKSETVRYLIMEKGRTTLPGGLIIEAGSFNGTTSFKTIPFAGTFNKVPVVVTTVVSMNESDGISGRLKNIGLKSFAYYFREQEKNTNVHATETVHYIAWEPGKGTIGSMQYEVGITGNKVTDAWYTHNYQNGFNQAPLLFADMQTTNGTDTSALRLQANTEDSFVVKVEEEQSKDTETSHGTETIGYLALNQTETSQVKESPIFSDDFSSDTSANYTRVGTNTSTGIAMDSGVAKGTAQYQVNLVVRGTTNSIDHYAQADIELATAAGSGVILGATAPGSNSTGYFVSISGSKSAKLYTFSGSTLTDTYKFWTLPTIALNTLYKMKVVKTGSSFALYLDTGSGLNHVGTDLTDGTYTTGSYVGIGFNQSAGYAPRTDNFEAGL